MRIFLVVLLLVSVQVVVQLVFQNFVVFVILSEQIFVNVVSVQQVLLMFGCFDNMVCVLMMMIGDLQMVYMVLEVGYVLLW